MQLFKSIVVFFFAVAAVTAKKPCHPLGGRCEFDSDCCHWNKLVDRHYCDFTVQTILTTGFVDRSLTAPFFICSTKLQECVWNLNWRCEFSAPQSLMSLFVSIRRPASNLLPSNIIYSFFFGVVFNKEYAASFIHFVIFSCAI